MADNARFHNKLHRKNHHSIQTPGYPDSATDPIASTEEPFEGNMVVNATVSAQNLWINTDAFIGRNTTIMGNLCVYGEDSYFETFATVTSAMSVINHGFGPALTVKQTGPEPIARFLDGDATGDENAFLIADTGQIVINASRPTLDRRVTISGSITASGNTEFQGGSATSSRSFAANDAAANNWDAAAFNTGHADGMRSFAVNYNTLAALSGTFAAGHTTKAVGDFSFTQGMRTVASGLGSHAEGLNTQSTGNNSHSEGIATTEAGSGAHTEGFNTRASGNFSHAEGITTLASSSGSHSEGIGTVAAGRGGHAEGQNTIVADTSIASHTEGFMTSAFGFFGHAEGQETVVFGAYNHTEGFGTSAFGINNHAEGYFSYTSGVGVHTEGYATSGFGSYSHAEGYLSVVSGEGAHAEGYGSIAFGPYSHAEGYLTNAFGLYSHTEGSETSAFGTGSKATGRSTVALGDYSYASGELTYAVSAARSEGYASSALGIYSHAEGFFNIASGANSHSEGAYNLALGLNSHAEGAVNIAYGAHSHAAGYFTVASGVGSMSLGVGTSAAGPWSYTWGYESISRGVGGYSIGYESSSSELLSYTLGYRSYSEHPFSYCYSTSGFQTQLPVRTTRANQYMVSAAGGVYIPGKVGIGVDCFRPNLSANTLTVAGAVSAHELIAWYTNSNQVTANNIYGYCDETVFTDGQILSGNGDKTLTMNYTNGIYVSAAPVHLTLQRSSASALIFARDAQANLYRSGTGTLRTDGSLLVAGNLSALGDFTYLDTIVSVTSALSVVNVGTGPALTVRQSGTQPIARFIDTDASGVDRMALFIENNGNIGMGTGLPSAKLTVVGAISGNNWLSAGNIDLQQANVRTFTNPATASGNFLVLNINGTNRGIRLWDVPAS